MNLQYELPPNYARNRIFEIPDERIRPKNIQQTSINAFTENAGKLSRREQEVYNTMRRMHMEGRRNMTDQEVKTYLGKLDANYVRPRRFELVERGLVVLDCKRRCSITNQTVCAWRVNENG